MAVYGLMQCLTLIAVHRLTKVKKKNIHNTEQNQNGDSWCPRMYMMHVSEWRHKERELREFSSMPSFISSFFFFFLAVEFAFSFLMLEHSLYHSPSLIVNTLYVYEWWLDVQNIGLRYWKYICADLVVSLKKDEVWFSFFVESTNIFSTFSSNRKIDRYLVCVNPHWFFSPCYFVFWK